MAGIAAMVLETGDEVVEDLLHVGSSVIFSDVGSTDKRLTNMKVA